MNERLKFLSDSDLFGSLPPPALEKIAERL